MKSSNTSLSYGQVQNSEIEPGTFRGGEIEPGTFHGGEIEPGTFHCPAKSNAGSNRQSIFGGDVHAIYPTEFLSPDVPAQHYPRLHS